MRWSGLLLCVPSVVGMLEDDACGLAGLRFARIPSTCVAGTCSSIARKPNGMYVAAVLGGREVPCGEAAGSVAEYFESLKSPVRRSKRLRRDPAVIAADIVASVAANVFPGIEVLAFGGSPWTGPWKADLEGTDRLIINSAAEDWELWKSDIAPLVRESTEIVMLLKFLGLIVRLAYRGSLVEARQEQGFQAAMAFFRILEPY